MDMLSRELGGVFIMGEHLFEKLARDRGITVEEMREIISARIRRGMNDSDPKKRAQGNEKRVYTPFDVVLAFFVSVSLSLPYLLAYSVGGMHSMLIFAIFFQFPNPDKPEPQFCHFAQEIIVKCLNA